MEKNYQVSRFVIPKPINAEPSTDHCRICRRYNLKLNWERCLSQKNLQPRPKGFSPISVLPGISGRPGSDSICFDKLFFFAPRNLGWLSEFSIASCDTA